MMKHLTTAFKDNKNSQRPIYFVVITKYYSPSYQFFISSFFWFSLLSLAILKYMQYFFMLQTLKLNNKKQKKIVLWKKFGRIDS
jgi:hypothetical protein